MQLQQSCCSTLRWLILFSLDLRMGCHRAPTIREAVPSGRDTLLDIWLRSVRATHTFLTEEDIQALLPEVRDALGKLELWILCSQDSRPIGFLGLSGPKVEALFMAPES